MSTRGRLREWVRAVGGAARSLRRSRGWERARYRTTLPDVSCPVCDGEDDECDCTAVDGEWTAAVRALLARPPHAEIVFEKDAVPDPENSGFARARGKPVGQTADYRLPLRTGGCVHVREFEDRYEVHRDRVAPSASRVGHLLVDMPLETATVVAVVALGLVRGGPSAGSIARRTLLASAGLLPGWN